MREKIYAVILASGVSRRLGTNKLTLKIDGESVIRRAVRPFLFAGVERVFVVAGIHGGRLGEEFKGISNVEFVDNPQYQEGMSSSVKAVLPLINGADGVFFHLGDKPFLKRDLVKAMLECYQAGDRNIIVPVFSNEKGHPVLMNINHYLQELEGLVGDKGLREVIEKHREDVLFMDGDEGCIFDIDTSDDIDTLKRRRHTVEKG
jgi:molybdenum cofactor cytidylyltransferase